MTDPITRLNAALEGRYRIDREIGEGGMATVYLAEDLRHHREVALKVLKPELAAVVGAERFLAEIQTTANLKHPHILPLFDSGEADAFLFFVMPFLEGESLRDRIDREKQLPVTDAVTIAAKVAGALQHAHEHGVVHRDIKPGNILLQDGEPIVADFGIALAVGAAGGSRLTETGLSVGTPYYMSPEQATGDQEVGPASDTFALACVLYEMLTGDPPYPGSTAQAVLGKIIQGVPVSATAARKSVPANVDAAIRKALEKLPADRFTGAQEFAKALVDPGFRHGDDVATAGAAAARGLWNPLSIGATVVAALAIVLAVWALRRPEPPLRVSRFELNLPEGVLPNFAGGVGLDVPPDGSQIVFVGNGSNGSSELWRRSLDQLVPTPIPGTAAARNPRFSPDGTTIAYNANGALLTVSLTGAPPATLVSESVASGGGIAWGGDGWIYFGKPDQTLWRVPAAGGPDEPLTTLREGDLGHWTPDVLPDGRGLIFTAGTVGGNQIAALSFRTGEITTLVQGTMARYVPSGHILYATEDGALLAAPFDLGRLVITGPARTLVQGIQLLTQSAAYFAVSKAGVLAYLPGSGGEFSETQLVWVSRTGVAQPVGGDWQFDSPMDDYGWRLSPSGDRVAVTQYAEDNQDIWIKELPDGPFERLTFDPAAEAYPVWTPDGDWVTYISGDLLNYNIWRRRADGTGQPELILDDQRSLLQPRWSRDGEWMVFRTTEGAAGRDIVGFRPGTDSTVVSLVESEDFTEWGPALSPDGRWLAYSSNETGREEVYVRPFPDVESGRTQVSTEGGSNPLWAHNSNELFYFEGSRRVVDAHFQTDPQFRVTEREPLFDLGSEYLLGDGGADFYDIAPDDQHFLIGRLAGAMEDVEPPTYVVVENLFEELRGVEPE